VGAKAQASFWERYVSDLSSWDYAKQLAMLASASLAMLGVLSGMLGYMKYRELKYREPKVPLGVLFSRLGYIFGIKFSISLQMASVPRGLIVDLLLPPDRAEDVLYNLLARYEYWLEKHGARWARIIFFTQSALAIGMFWTDWAMKRLKLLKMFVSN
jgi:hypothetical protein